MQAVRAHRQARAVERDRVPLHRRRLAARRRARELSPAALAAPALPASGVPRPAHMTAAARRARARLRVVRHDRLRLTAIRAHQMGPALVG